jgi:signal transduction histidine kinase/CheY-like chemotaxis protein
MEIAKPSRDEQERLKALFDYEILDTEAEKVFDDLTRLTSEICGTPIALISLVDPKRQWFKSKLGLGADETSRDIAFCAHAINQREIFEVCDTLKDERFADNPLVTSDPSIRFYAGAQLITPDGYAIGTLCAIDKKPNQLTQQQRDSLEILAHSVVSQFELRKHIKQLEQASKHKTEFLSNMSHELRTPLNAIISFSRLMLEDIKTLDVPSKFAEYLKHMDYSGERLLSVINAILDLSKIEEGHMQLEPSSIHSRLFFERIKGMLGVSAAEKGILFNIIIDDSVPPYIDFDETKLTQILTNLINNSIKFTTQNKHVDVNILVHDNEFVMVVKDQGIGISKADQLKLFNKFQRVGNTNMYEGTGLGLSITKGLVELMGGSIALTSREDSGSLFKVVLPLSKSKNEKEAEDKGPDILSLSCKVNSNILVVEDNFINQEVIKAIFGSIDLPIQLADSGEHALELVADSTFDVIFMDIQLPGIDGNETTRLIKQKYPSLPIIGLSADAFEQHNFVLADDQNSSTGMSDYLIKPVERQQLIRVLNRFLPYVDESEEEI